MSKNKQPNGYDLTSTNGDKYYVSTQPALWGIRLSNKYWWSDDGGVVFHTEYENIAIIQAMILTQRGMMGHVAERIQ